jgi:hypothetical protein
MDVRKKEIVEGKRDAVAHHLALRPFTAIEQQGLSLPNDSEGTDSAFHGGSGGGGAEKSHEQGHVWNIGGTVRISVRAGATGARPGPARGSRRGGSAVTRNGGLRFA